MSLSSVAASARRASAAIKAAQQPGVAKRGMFALIERRHSYMSLRDGHHAWHTYTPCVVSSVTRDGIAKEVRIAGQSWPLKDREWVSILIDSAGRIASPENVAGEMVDERGFALEYKDRNEAVAAIQAAAGIDAKAV